MRPGFAARAWRGCHPACIPLGHDGPHEFPDAKRRRGRPRRFDPTARARRRRLRKGAPRLMASPVRRRRPLLPPLLFETDDGAHANDRAESRQVVCSPSPPPPPTRRRPPTRRWRRRGWWRRRRPRRRRCSLPPRAPGWGVLTAAGRGPSLAEQGAKIRSYFEPANEGARCHPRANRLMGLDNDGIVARAGSAGEDRDPMRRRRRRQRGGGGDRGAAAAEADAEVAATTTAAEAAPAPPPAAGGRRAPGGRRAWRRRRRTRSSREARDPRARRERRRAAGAAAPRGARDVRPSKVNGGLTLPQRVAAPEEATVDYQRGREGGSDCRFEVASKSLKHLNGARQARTRTY